MNGPDGTSGHRVCKAEVPAAVISAYATSDSERCPGRPCVELSLDERRWLAVTDEFGHAAIAQSTSVRTGTSE